MESFSDGVLAFAITLLVLDIALRPPGSPTMELFRAWAAFLAYLVSFLTIGAVWMAHHGLTNRLERVDALFLRLNLLFLLTVAFLPFPTRLVVGALNESTAWQRMAAVVYGLTLLLIRLLFAALGWYVRREHLRKPGNDDPDLQEARRKFGYVVVGYVLTILIGLFVPKVAILLYFGIAIFLFVPFRTAARVISGRTAA